MNINNISQLVSYLQTDHFAHKSLLIGTSDLIFTEDLSDLIKTIQSYIKVKHFIQGPFELDCVIVPNESHYEDPNPLIATLLFELVPRTLCFISFDQTVIKVYGLKKFGSWDQEKLGSTISIKDSFHFKPLINITQKHNGEAGVITSFLINKVNWFLIMSKTVPIIVRTIEDLELLELADIKYNTAKDIGRQFFKKYNDLVPEFKNNLNLILNQYILSIEKIDETFKHIAKEEPGLVILTIKDKEFCNILNLEESKYIREQLILYGFRDSEKYSTSKIILMINKVMQEFSTLPFTEDKPTIEDLQIAFDDLGKINKELFIRVWTYVSLVHILTTINDPDPITLLKMVSGIETQIILTEGTIIDIGNNKIKTKDVLYYLFRGIRTYISKLKNGYNNEPLISKSLNFWIRYLPIKWKESWNKLLQIVTNYLNTYNFLQFIKKSGMVDAVDFFNNVLDYELKKEEFNPILISIQESSEIINYLESIGGKYLDNKLYGLTTLGPNSITYMINFKVSGRKPNKYGNNLTHLKYTSLKPDNLFGALKSFCIDLLDSSTGICYTTIEDLNLAIDKAKKNIYVKQNIIQDKNSIRTSTIRYFNSYPIDLSKSIQLLVQKNIGFTKKEPTLQDKQVAEYFEQELEIPSRNIVDYNEIADNIVKEYMKNEKKLTVFVTGIPGCGKDTMVLKVIEIIRNIYEIDCQVINQDMYGGNRNLYLEQLSKLLKTNVKIIFITRNGPGSHESIKRILASNSQIYLLYPQDSPLILLEESIKSVLFRKISDPTHCLSNLPNDKIVSICTNFIDELNASNIFIAGNKQTQFLAINILNTNLHVTLEYGIINFLDLIGEQVNLQTYSIVNIIGPNNYKIKFYMIDPNSFIYNNICEFPHITLEKNGHAKSIHSKYWMEYIYRIYGNLNMLDFQVGEYIINIQPAIIDFNGFIELY